MPELLELVEAPFDEIALLVALFAVGDPVVAMSPRRDVGRAILVLDQLSDPIGIIAFVRQHMRAGRQMAEEQFGHRRVVGFASRQLDLYGKPVADDAQVHLGRQSSTTSTDKSISSLIFGEAACW